MSENQNKLLGNQDSKEEKKKKEKKEKDKKGKEKGKGLGNYLKKIKEITRKVFSWIGSSTRKLFTFEKKTTKKTWKKAGVITGLVVLGLLAVGLITFSVGIYGYHWDNKPAQVAKKVVPFPAALVGFDVVSISQVEEDADRIEHFRQNAKQASANLPDESTIKNQMLERLIDNKIIEGLAKKYDVSVESKEIEDQYKKLVEKNGGKEKVKSMLKDLYGITPVQFKDLLASQLRMEKLKQKFEDELRKKIRVRHILVKVDSDAKKKEKKKAKSKAKKLLKKVKKEGADFAKIAKNNSQDKASKDKGGKLPWFGKGDMIKEFEKAAFSLEVGKISDVVETKYGYHIIKLEEKKGEIEKDFQGWLKEAREDRFVKKLIKW